MIGRFADFVRRIGGGYPPEMSALSDLQTAFIRLENQVLDQGEQMAAIDDALAKLKTDFAAAAARVNEDVSTIKAAMAELQAKLDAGANSLTPEQQAAFDELDAAIVAMDPVPTPPTP
ncbi:unnamed protein product [uncultured bacterium]|nr:unnamed protein product [uncultured bacterium]